MLSTKYGQIHSLSAHAKILASADFSEARVARYIVAWAESLPQTLPLVAFDQQLTDDWVLALHNADHRQPPKDISCYFCRDICISGRGHLYIDNDIILSDEFVPNYWRNLITETDSLSIDEEQSLPEIVVDEPTLLVCGHGIEVYGHFLIETMPKLMVARRALGSRIKDFKILLQTAAPNWLLNIFKDVFSLQDSQFLFYNSHRERVLLRKAILPTLASFDGWFHPFCNTLIDEVIRLAGDEARAISVPRLFISRATFTDYGDWGRRTTNELRLAEIAAKEFGFCVVSAETFPWRTQIGLFHNAEIVVGEFGSAMHSAMFSRAGTVIGSMGIGSMAQSMIGALRQHHNGYMRLDFDQDRRASVDEDVFRLFLTKLVAASAVRATPSRR